MPSLNFKPKQTTKKILADLHDRAYDVLSGRFGLGDDLERKTLEAIGQKYGITRERVRQIENSALNTVRKSDAFKAEEAAFNELRDYMIALGGVVAEDDLLSSISKDVSIQNHIHLHLVLHDSFEKHKEDEHFKSRWSVDPATADEVHASLKKLYESLSDDELVAEPDLVDRFLADLKKVAADYKKEEIAKRWLGMSKAINRNPLGEWGKAHSSNVKTRGVKDYAFLIMRKHGSPMHFREVAKAITETFGKKTHTATCHNELIKDKRFVLVGRGIYALADWGYKSGVVKDVIRDILKKEGPMSKDAIIDRVLKERYLKKNTVLVNLQNAKHFKKNKNGLYTLA